MTGDLLVPFDNRNRAVEARPFDRNVLAITGPPVRLVSDVRNTGGIPTVGVSLIGSLVCLGGTIDRPCVEYDARGFELDTVRSDGTWTIAAQRAHPGRGITLLRRGLPGFIG